MKYYYLFYITMYCVAVSWRIIGAEVYMIYGLEVKCSRLWARVCMIASESVKNSYVRRLVGVTQNPHKHKNKGNRSRAEETTKNTEQMCKDNQEKEQRSSDDEMIYKNRNGRRRMRDKKKKKRKRRHE